MRRGSIETARAIYSHALSVFPGKKSIWRRAAQVWRGSGWLSSVPARWHGAWAGHVKSFTCRPAQARQPNTAVSHPACVCCAAGEGARHGRVAGCPAAQGGTVLPPSRGAVAHGRQGEVAVG